MNTLVTGEKPIVKKQFHFREPNKTDGAAVWELIKSTGNLDLNSSYSYLMWCEVFAKTSIVTFEDENNKTPVGFVSGYIHPERQDTLFIWQVAVHESQRGQGLATKMLVELLERNPEQNLQYIEATVSPSNTASQNLFTGLARKFHTDYSISRYFEEEDFPEASGEEHEAEELYKIGPFK